MGWRDHYKVHPAADVFPMMDDDDLAKLGEDIKRNAQAHPVLLWNDVIIDGRNRMEAMERVGIVDRPRFATIVCDDPVPAIITLNIRRRHLTKAQQAELIVAATKAGEKPVQPEPVSKGGRGKVNGVKAEAVAAGQEHGISESTIKRALAKAEGKIPKALFDQKRAIEAELKRQGHPGADFCHVMIFDAKQSKAMGGEAKPTIGYVSASACTGDVAKEAFDAAAAAVAAKAEEPDETIVDADGVEVPAQVVIDALDSINNAKSIARAYCKIFKASSFDSEQKAQLRKAIGLLIAKWRRVDSILDDEGAA